MPSIYTASAVCVILLQLFTGSVACPNAFNAGRAKTVNFGVGGSGSIIIPVSNWTIHSNLQLFFYNESDRFQRFNFYVPKNGTAIVHFQKVSSIDFGNYSLCSKDLNNSQRDIMLLNKDQGGLSDWFATYQWLVIGGAFSLVVLIFSMACSCCVIRMKTKSLEWRVKDLTNTANAQSATLRSLEKKEERDSTTNSRPLISPSNSKSAPYLTCNLENRTLSVPKYPPPPPPSTPPATTCPPNRLFVEGTSRASEENTHYYQDCPAPNQNPPESFRRVDRPPLPLPTELRSKTAQPLYDDVPGEEHITADRPSRFAKSFRNFLRGSSKISNKQSYVNTIRAPTFRILDGGHDNNEIYDDVESTH